MKSTLVYWLLFALAAQAFAAPTSVEEVTPVIVIVKPVPADSTDSVTDTTETAVDDRNVFDKVAEALVDVNIFVNEFADSVVEKAEEIDSGIFDTVVDSVVRDAAEVLKLVAAKTTGNVYTGPGLLGAFFG